MVRGQRLDEAAIGRVLDGAGLVIAHNAGFDRPFVEARLPAFAVVAVGVLAAGGAVGQPRSRAAPSSTYLAYRYGFFFEGHRAEIDCRALLEVLRRRSPSRRAVGGTAGGTTAFRLLLDSAREPSLPGLGHGVGVRDQGRAQGARLPLGGRPALLVW